LIPYNPNVTYVVFSSLAVLLLALYIHAYNLWRTMRGWKGSPGEKLARDVAASKT
jgi:hypothetical protein